MGQVVELREGVIPATGEVVVWDTDGWTTRAPHRPRSSRVHTDHTVMIVMNEYRSPNFESGVSGWSFKADGSLEANNITARGTIYADTGEIGGWTIGATQLYNGSDIGLDAGNKRIWIGNSGFATAGFQAERYSTTARLYVGDGGTQYLQFDGLNAKVAGLLYATGGLIGGFSIGSDFLYAGAGVNRVGLAPGTYPFYAGSETPSVAPFRVSSAGALTATAATITGTITAEDGTIGGFTIAANELYAGSGATRTGLAPGSYPFYAGNETPSAAPFRVTSAGALTATSGTVAGWTLASDSLANGTDIVLHATSKYISIGSPTWEAAGIQIQYNSGTPRMYVGDGSTHYMRWSGAVLMLNGAVVTGIQTGSEIAIQGWQFDAIFSAVDADTVAWTSGTLRFLNGDYFSIGAGNTGNMTARTYIYFDKGTSETALQITTTASNAVGIDKVLIAVAQNGTNEATWQVFGGRGGIQVTGEDIEANSITANQITAGTITADEIASNTITSNEIAANTITAGEIYAGTITATQIAANTITAGEILAHTITASEIAASTITGTEIAADAISASHIDVTTLSAIQVNTGALTMSGVLSIGSSGGIYQGTGTFGSPTTGLKVWNDGGVGRIGGYNSGTLQWYADSDGRIYGGGGAVRIEATGLMIRAESLYDSTRAIRFMYAPTDWSNPKRVGRLYSATQAGGSIYLVAERLADSIWSVARLCLKADDQVASRSAEIIINTDTFAKVEMPDTCVGNGFGLVVGSGAQAPYDNDVVIYGGLWVGSILTNPADDNIYADGDIWAGSGLAVGATSGLTAPDAGQLEVYHATGDPRLALIADTQYWTMGIDADDDSFKIHNANTLPATARMRIQTDGRVNFDGSVVGHSFRTTRNSGSLSANDSTTQSIVMELNGRYILSCSLYGSYTDVSVIAAVSVPRTANVNVGWTILESQDFQDGSITLATQNGGAEYAVNASSNFTIKVTFTTGATYPATWAWHIIKLAENI